MMIFQICSILVLSMNDSEIATIMMIRRVKTRFHAYIKITDTYPPTPRLKLEEEASRKDRRQRLNLRPKTNPKTASSHPLGLNPAGVSLFRTHATQSPLRTDCGTFWHAFALLLAASRAGVSLFRMHAAQSPLRTDCGTFWHAFALRIRY